VRARPVLGLAAVALLTPVALSACGGSEVVPAAGSSATPAATAAPSDPPTDVNPEEPGQKVKLEKPQAAETILPSATMSAVPGTTQIYSPADARTVHGFPVPKGAKVTDPGAIEETWQFDIATRKPDDVIEFYREVLPQLGYTVRTDVTYENAYEKVHWDLVFDGKVSGSIVRDDRHHTVFVVVNPPGQPAFPGDDQQ
jgi:hypothetical protein